MISDIQVSELTVEQLRTLLQTEVRALVHEAMQELLWEIEQHMPDPDEGLSFRPEVAAYLSQAMRHQERGTPLDDVVRELGLDE